MASAVSCVERSVRTVRCFTDGYGRGGLAGYLGVTRARESGVHPCVCVPRTAWFSGARAAGKAVALAGRFVAAPRKIPAF